MSKTYERNITNMAIHMLDKNLTFFIGAGFSMIFGYPSWSELLTEIITENSLREKLMETNLFPFFDETTLKKFNIDNKQGIEGESLSLKINEIIMEKLLGVDYLRLAGYIDVLLKDTDKKSIHSEVVNKIKNCSDKRKHNRKTKEIRDFFSKNIEYLNDIITTNYDDNIEMCFNNNISVINRNLSSLNEANFNNRLYKIHGCINDSGSDEDKRNSIIITEKDYNNFVSENKYLFYKVYSFFTERKMVFIGYSINDPNIRSLLNDVIEENNKKVALEMYWVTRDKMKELDKKYYKNHFNLEIIEEYEISTFLKELQKSIDIQREIRSGILEELSDIIEKYKKDCSDVYIKEIQEKGNVEDALKYLFNDIYEGSFYSNINPYIKLLVSSEDSVVEGSIPRLYDILEFKKQWLYEIIRIVNENEDYNDFFRRKNIDKKVVDNLIQYASGLQNFGEYAESIRALLLGYKCFSKIIKSKMNEYIEVLEMNIYKSCFSDNKMYGYDWKGMDIVKKYIEHLDNEALDNLMKKMIEYSMDALTWQKLECIIEHSLPSMEWTERRFHYLEKNFIAKCFGENLKRVIDELGGTNIGKMSFEINGYTFHIKTENSDRIYKAKIFKLEETIGTIELILFDNDLDNVREVKILNKDEKVLSHLEYKFEDRLDHLSIYQFNDDLKQILSDSIQYF